MRPEIILKIKEQFKAEEMAYTTYCELKKMVEDEYLEEALEEIMYDEFLHAKFLRTYLMKMNAYDPKQHVDLEQAYLKMLDSE
jgi:rubrerythrin